jgi:hypothetical protein
VTAELGVEHIGEHAPRLGLTLAGPLGAALERDGDARREVRAELAAERRARQRAGEERALRLLRAALVEAEGRERQAFLMSDRP